jgi:AcrR family transcriptional regulator
MDYFMQRIEQTDLSVCFFVIFANYHENSPRERILNTASILFHKQGYNNTGINQIIADSGVSKASFYDHFKSKDDLCLEFLNQRYEYWSSQWNAFISKASNQKEKYSCHLIS